MRERSIRVKCDVLEELNKIYRPGYILRSLDVSKQVWYTYRKGKNDIPEPMLNKICDKFNIKKADLIEAVP